MTDAEENIDYSEFKSIDLVLAEARHSYDDEVGRFQGLESKAGIILSAEALLLTLLMIFKDEITFYLLLIGFLFISIIFGLISLKFSKYQTPGKIDNYYKYVKMEEKEFLDKILNSYISSIQKNIELNDKKANNLRVSYFFLGVFVIIIIYTTLIITLFSC